VPSTDWGIALLPGRDKVGPARSRLARVGPRTKPPAPATGEPETVRAGPASGRQLRHARPDRTDSQRRQRPTKARTGPQGPGELPPGRSGQRQSRSTARQKRSASIPSPLGPSGPHARSQPGFMPPGPARGCAAQGRRRHQRTVRTTSRQAYHFSSGKTGLPKASPFWARSPVPTMRHPPSPLLSACVRRCPLLSAFERGYGAGPRPGLGPDLKCPTGVLSELLDAALAGRGRALR
jgi:hypothetical protein